MNYRLSLLAVSTLILAGCTHVKEESIQTRKPGSDYESDKYPFIPNFPVLDFQTLSKLIVDSKSQTVGQALYLTSNRYGTYMKFHTLMYDSRSLQGGSFEEPRAIVFGPTADFIFTFNGNPHQRGGATIETAEYNSETKQLQFREILFKKENVEESDILKEEEIELQTENVRISKANPGKCTLCHTTHAIPIFDTYFLWPGAYGSNDDILTQSLIPTEGYNSGGDFNNSNNHFFNNIKIQSQGRTIKMRGPDIEAEKYLNFLNSKPGHQRYQYLPNRVVDDLALKNAAGTLVHDLNAKQKIQNTSRQLSVSLMAVYRPNEFLMDKLYEHSLSRFSLDAKQSNLKGKFAEEGIKLKMFEKNDKGQYEMEFPKAFVNKAAKKLGSLPDFFQDLAKREIQMQCSKMSIMRNNLGDPQFGDGQTEDVERNFYLKKPEFCSEEDFKYAKLTENDVEDMYRIAYVLEYFDFSLSNYAINLGRIQTLHGSYFDPYLKELFE